VCFGASEYFSDGTVMEADVKGNKYETDHTRNVERHEAAKRKVHELSQKAHIKIRKPVSAEAVDHAYAKYAQMERDQKRKHMPATRSKEQAAKRVYEIMQKSQRKSQRKKSAKKAQKKAGHETELGEAKAVNDKKALRKRAKRMRKKARTTLKKKGHKVPKDLRKGGLDKLAAKKGTSALKAKGALKNTKEKMKKKYKKRYKNE
jgi:hypothetical protein